MCFLVSASNLLGLVDLMDCCRGSLRGAPSNNEVLCAALGVEPGQTNPNTNHRISCLSSTFHPSTDSHPTFQHEVRAAAMEVTKGLRKLPVRTGWVLTQSRVQGFVSQIALQERGAGTEMGTNKKWINYYKLNSINGE